MNPRKPCRNCNQQNPSHDPYEPICKSLRRRQQRRNGAAAQRWALEGHYDRLWNERLKDEDFFYV